MKNFVFLKWKSTKEARKNFLVIIKVLAHLEENKINVNKISDEVVEFVLYVTFNFYRYFANSAESYVGSCEDKGASHSNH